MGILKRIFGICRTRPPAAVDAWKYEDGRVKIDLAKTPELREENGAIRLEGRGLPVRILVFKGAEGRYFAYHNKCTHAGRRLDPMPDGQSLECCSVSKSSFDLEGGYLSGPTKGEIKVFPVEEKEGELIIDLSIAAAM